MAFEFEDQYNEFRRFPREQGSSRLVSFLINNHLARDERDANKKALIVAIVVIIISSSLFFWANTRNNTKEALYNFPDELLRRLPPELQIRIKDVIYGARR